MADSFKAIIVEEQLDGKFTMRTGEKSINDLPENEVLIRVKYSGLNYKDALSATGNKGITKKYPHTPGIDASGIVAHSSVPDFKEGDEVIVTGYDLGMNTSGGLAEYIRVPASWIVKRPVDLSLEESMIIGTSGFTAASGIFEFLQHGLNPEDGEVLVTGATGAVGSIAVAMLAKCGFSVCAVTGKESAVEWLKELGATRIINRQEADDQTGRPLLKARWSAVLDTVGGNMLSTAIRSTKERGIITNCGMIASNTIDVSVFPFILRAVRLIGIASAETPMMRRLEIWNLITSRLKPENLNSIARKITLEQCPDELMKMLSGNQQGKVIVEL
ncbi:MAG: YhdH/YhfP family quinone oxidoreductase [Omnitrophica WOR_2 bacterium]